MTNNHTHQKVCPHCGFHENDFTKTLRLGCWYCYEVFGPELATFLPRMQPGSRHVGKIPKQARSETRQLEAALKEVEHLLASSNLPSDQSDTLLDQWKELAMQLEASCPTNGKHHE